MKVFLAFLLKTTLTTPLLIHRQMIHFLINCFSQNFIRFIYSENKNGQNDRY